MTTANHEWNFVKIDNKWYNLDNLNYVMLLGSEDLNYRNQKSIKKLYGLDGKEYQTWKNRISKSSFVISKEKDNEIRIKIGLDPID